VAEPRATELEALIGWWADQGGDPADARGIADWWWLQASMRGCVIPQCFIRAQPGLVAGELSDADGLRLRRPAATTSAADDRASDSAPAPGTLQQDPSAPTVFPDPPLEIAEKSKPTAGLFTEAQLPDDDDVRERLKRRKGFVPLMLRQEPMLQRQLSLLSALRPLLDKQPHPYRRVLNEVLTAEYSADLGRPWPVLRPRLAATMEVDLWLDAGVAMAVWQPFAEELKDLLANSYAFLRVRLRHCDLKQLETVCLDCRPNPSSASITMLTLVLSDTAGRHWWDGSMTRWLKGIADQGPLAVLHTLPIRYRVRTALRRGEAVTLSNSRRLAPNSEYLAESVASLDPRRWRTADQKPLPEGLKLPVLALNPRDLAPWGALVMGDALARTAGAVLPVDELQLNASSAPEVPAAPRLPQGPEADAEALWLAFRQQASPEAQRLMLLMAAAPLLTLPVLRLLMAAELPDLADPLPLAEVLVSGLVRRREGLPESSPNAVQFELLPAVQALLEPQLEPKARVAVIQAITDLLERRLARLGSGPSFETLVSDPNAAARPDAAGLAHFANLTAAMLDRLPGQPFREIARQLRAAGGSGPTMLWPAAMAFKQQPFETAQLVDTPAVELLTVTAARWQEFPLQLIAFPTLRPADLDRFLRQVDREGGEAARASLPTATAWAFHEPLRREGLAFGATAERPAPLALTLVEIPAGSFQMGSPGKEAERFADEGPQHEVTLASFFISQTPITQAQWREVAGWQPLPAERWGRELDPEPSYFWPRRNPKARGYSEGRFSLLPGEASSDLRPVENVSWEDAMEFCKRLSQRTGRRYSLPSEAQWEYACRGESSTPFAFGKTLSPELANYDGNYIYANGPKGHYRKHTTAVGMFPANGWGLQDMHGNVWEWCLDHWHENYEGASIDGSPWLNGVAQDGQRSAQQQTDGTNDSKLRLLRGGSWTSGPRFCRSAFRYWDHPGSRDDSVGFRVCCLPQDLFLYP
jgi:formylglycine-generating enzyme required for sulfatase activity